MEDPNNLDAYVQMAFLMPTIGEGIKLLEKAEADGMLVPNVLVYNTENMSRSCHFKALFQPYLL